MFAVHPAVFPFNGERAGVLDIVQRDDDLLEVDVAAAGGAEIPVAGRVGECGVAAEHADGPVAVAPPGVFHVDVEDAVLRDIRAAERADELHVIHVLIAEVGRVEVEAEPLVPLHGFNGALG